MRYFTVLILVSICFFSGSKVDSKATLQTRDMIATIYDDGKSCPNGCDAHVVFNQIHNGTRNVFDPSGDRASPLKCVIGRECSVCFADEDTSCMTAVYRGGGPDVGRFDFTPAFYETNCPKPNLPTAFASVCRKAQPVVDRLKNQVNCIASPEHPKCKAMMDTVIKRKVGDDALYDECKSLGEGAFNRKYSARPQMQRRLACAYERQRTMKNSKGQRWSRLLDGACRTGTYVGRDGLDCCTGNLYAAALLGSECRMFFVEK